jgi:hypothetical protein
MTRALPFDADAIPRRPDERIGDRTFERDPLPPIVEHERRIPFAADDMEHTADDECRNRHQPATRVCLELDERSTEAKVSTLIGECHS